MKLLKLSTILFISSLTALSCSKDDHHDDHDHEGELITTVIYTLTNNANSTDVVTLTYEDLDGPGGAVETTNISGPLKANATYTGTLQLLNATVNPAQDITLEVEAEGHKHEFFFTNNAGLTISKTDQDTNGNPIGIETTVTTGNATTGTITVILKHEPTKPNNGEANNAGGSTDAEVTFSITIE